MAEGYQEPYHVPQQSRRDKLREGCALHPHDGAGLLQLPSDLLTCAVEPFFLSGQSQPVVYRPESLSLSLSSENRSFVAGSSSGGLGRSSVPLGPFTGYASILKGSRFLRPAREMMEEICDVARGGMYGVAVAVEMESGPGEMDLGGGEVADDMDGGGEGRRRKSRLIALLDEVYKRYKYYYQQMQAVVASFESVPGISNAAPFANLALKAMSKHFRTLKTAILNQLRSANKSSRNDDISVFGDTDGIIRFGQRSTQNMGVNDNQPVWRPQRGLPERAVAMLRAWLFDHFLHPYPTDTDKMMLAKQTGLSRNQVSNWFINARVRLWKPMVEEIHNLETRQAQKSSQESEQTPNMINNNNNFPTSQNPTTFAIKTLDLPSKRAKNNFRGMSSNSTEEPMCSYYENLSNNQMLLGGGLSTPSGAGNISLTLGLQQNHGIRISEPFPINAARRFGLDNNQGYILGNYQTQNREFGRDIISGQLYDFVG